MEITKLIQDIQSVDVTLKSEANKSVNQLLTIRNLLIGHYIVEYEQNGEDRAKYGAKLLQTLAEKLNQKGLSYRNLREFKKFYLAFPEIWQTATAKLESKGLLTEIQQNRIRQSSTAQFDNSNDQNWQLPIVNSENTEIPIWQSAIVKFKEPEFQEEISEEEFLLGQKILEKLAYTHILQLIPLKDKLQRAFYAIEAIKGTWSVSELKRQINSLLFERSGLSQHPELLIEKINSSKQEVTKVELVKDIYSFEFLGLPISSAVEESDLETGLLDHLRTFILELGNGFCLEARQKRILIGDDYFFIDLVFYHRILKCHVLVELKIDEFNHVNAGQLNTYLNYYKKEVKEETDNDPIGILLVTNKNDALVEYATAGMDENLFVSKYMLQLPSKEKLKEFIINEIKSYE